MKKTPDINVLVEKLIVKGASQSRARSIAHSIEKNLHQLLSELPKNQAAVRTNTTVSLEKIEISTGSNYREIGRSIAHSVVNKLVAIPKSD